MSLLKLYTPNNVSSFQFGSTALETKIKKEAMMTKLLLEDDIIDSKYGSIENDKSLLQLRSTGSTPLYGNIIKYRKAYYR